MKKLLILLFIASLATISYGQEIDSPNEKQQVVETNLSKNSMWINLKKWVSSTFKDYKCVVDFEDKEAGVMKLKWNSPINVDCYSGRMGYLTGIVNSSLTVEVKDNKYRFTIPKASVHITTGSIDMNHSRTVLLLIAKDLKFVKLISENYFNSQLDWTMDSKLDDIISAYNKELDSIQTRNAKGEVNSDWTEKYEQVNFLTSLKSSYLNSNEIIRLSLEIGMKETNDF
ncbi:MAG: DUF4468 domain-containing protein [Paludibacter sp.]|nr:DUF4468 domain-containing protein [Paludibacter sp.]